MLRIICPLYIESKCTINENYEENFESIKPIINPLNFKIKFQKIHRTKTFNHSCKVSTWLFLTVLIVNGQKCILSALKRELNGK